MGEGLQERGGVLHPRRISLVCSSESSHMVSVPVARSSDAVQTEILLMEVQDLPVDSVVSAPRVRPVKHPHMCEGSTPPP